MICIIAKCDHPFPRLTDSATQVQVSGYGDPAIVGIVVTFSCPSELTDMVLTGPNVSTCTGNGEWKPDPMDTMCKGTRNYKIIIVIVIIMYQLFICSKL